MTRRYGGKLWMANVAAKSHFWMELKLMVVDYGCLNIYKQLSVDGF